MKFHLIACFFCCLMLPLAGKAQDSTAVPENRTAARRDSSLQQVHPKPKAKQVVAPTPVHDITADTPSQTTAPATDPNGKNPFDIERGPDSTLQAHAVQSQPAARPAEIALSPGANPFDVAPVKVISREQVAAEKSKPRQIIHLLKPVSAQPRDKNQFFWTILLMLVMLAVAVTLNRNVVRHVYLGFMNDNAMKLLYKEQSVVGSVSYFVLYLLFLINGGLFIYLVLDYYKAPAYWTGFTEVFMCVAGFSLVMMIKHLILFYVGSVFPVAKEVRLYNFVIVMFGIVAGLVLAPMNLFIAYSPADISDLFVVITFILLAGIYLFRVLRSLFIASPFMGFHKFHFFLYLCAVEVAPVLVLLKLILLQSGIQ